jgi:MYXO-CTERM domain-containing protein
MTNDPLRECNPPGDSPHWPEDVSEIHETGIIYAATMWDFRAMMIASLGEAAGVAYADRIYYETIQRAVDIPSTYVEALGADDDDGDVANGTPNMCAINQAWASHGLADPGAEVGPGVGRPVQSGLHVDVPINGSTSTLCPGRDVQGIVMNWSLREDPSVSGTVQLTEGTGVWSGDIPPAPDGSVVNFQVTATYEDGTTVTYPDNPADPRYEIFVGDVDIIFCTDFESEPAGWTHGLTSGMAGEGADDWMWGEPQGTSGSGDPRMAYSGVNVYGNDLGGGNFNGQYQADKVNYLLTHVVDVSAYSNVRIQYRRWLNVEDATYDHGNVYSNDVLVWSNAANPAGNVHHTDREWRFHDIPITHAVGGTAQIKFEIQSDAGLQFGGWTIDDFCLVAYRAAVCGDGNQTGGETCDDGNTEDGDGCSSTCMVETPSGGDGGPGNGDGGPMLEGDASGCGCRTGGADAGGGLALAFLMCGIIAIVRRRR